MRCAIAVALGVAMGCLMLCGPGTATAQTPPSPTAPKPQQASPAPKAEAGQSCADCQSLRRQIADIDKAVSRLQREQNTLRRVADLKDPGIQRALNEDDAKIAALQKDRVKLTERQAACEQACPAPTPAAAPQPQSPQSSPPQTTPAPPRECRPHGTAQEIAEQEKRISQLRSMMQQDDKEADQLYEKYQDAINKFGRYSSQAARAWFDYQQASNHYGSIGIELYHAEWTLDYLKGGVDCPYPPSVGGPPNIFFIIDNIILNGDPVPMVPEDPNPPVLPPSELIVPPELGKPPLPIMAALPRAFAKPISLAEEQDARQRATTTDAASVLGLGVKPQPGADVAKNDVVLIDAADQQAIAGGKVVIIPSDAAKPMPPPVRVKADGKASLPPVEPDDRVVVLAPDHRKVELTGVDLPIETGARVPLPEKPLRLVVHDASCVGIGDDLVAAALADQYGAQPDRGANDAVQKITRRFGTPEFVSTDCLVSVARYTLLKRGGVIVPKAGPTITRDGRMIEGDQPREIQNR